MIDRIYKQVSTLTAEIIATGLCDHTNFPSRSRYRGGIEEISVSKADYTVSLKNISYAEMFRVLDETRTYNMKMIDGALITLSYKFKNNTLMEHRLSFFPSPDLEMFQNEPEQYLDDELYSDIVDKRIVTVHIRFDFNISERVFEPVEHPISHLTLGQYKNCRIPVSAALTPFQFLSFIIRNFYHTAHLQTEKHLSIFKDCFDTTIFDEERKLLHMNTPIEM